MTSTSLYDEYASTEEGSRELAAAHLAMQASKALNQALAMSGLESQKDLAAKVGVSEGRVSQVLRGDGNLRLSTLAKFLHAMGFVVSLRIEPRESQSMVGWTGRRRRRSLPAGDEWTRLTGLGKLTTTRSDRVYGTHPWALVRRGPTTMTALYESELEEPEGPVRRLSLR